MMALMDRNPSRRFITGIETRTPRQEGPLQRVRSSDAAFPRPDQREVSAGLSRRLV